MANTYLILALTKPTEQMARKTVLSARTEKKITSNFTRVLLYKLVYFIYELILEKKVTVKKQTQIVRVVVCV